MKAVVGGAGRSSVAAPRNSNYTMAPAPNGAPAWTGTTAAPGAATNAGRVLGDAMRMQYMLQDKSLEQLQAEYLRQRSAVLEELRQAKQEAEEERRKIMAKISKTLGNSRWRS